MNKLSIDDRARIVHALVEGNSLRSTSRMTGIAYNTVLRLLVDVGKACIKLHDENVYDVAAKRIQCDEIWSFIQ